MGNGGGFILGPTLITMGINPVVNAATLLYLIVFSSGASSCMFLIFGKLNVMYMLWLALFTGFGVVLGLFVMKKIMQKYKRPSLVALCLAVAILISFILSAVSSVHSLKE